MIEQTLVSPARERTNVRLQLVAVVFALVGGLLGILGAFAAEVQTNALLLVFIGAPMIEEIVKPVGVYLFMFRWRDVLRNQLHIALLVAISGIVFGLLESLVYVTVYAPDHSQAFFIYRFTVTVALHGIASFIAGLGLNSALIAWTDGQGPFPRRARWAFLTAIALHAAYNTTVVVLELTNVVTFD